MSAKKFDNASNAIKFWVAPVCTILHVWVGILDQSALFNKDLSHSETNMSLRAVNLLSTHCSIRLYPRIKSNAVSFVPQKYLISDGSGNSFHSSAFLPESHAAGITRHMVVFAILRANICFRSSAHIYFVFTVSACHDYDLHVEFPASRCCSPLLTSIRIPSASASAAKFHPR